MKKKIFAAFLLALLLALSAAPVAWAETVDYAVTGGNIQFDPATGIITDCDQSVTEANIPEKIGDVVVSGIGQQAFSGCDQLANVTIPNSVTTIGNRAFAHCTGLTSIIIPDSVTTINDSTFYGCYKLDNITIPNSVTTISNRAFQQCTSLTSITIPESVTTIGQYAFFRCTQLTSITISDGVTTIADAAFRQCSSLTSITIPNSVTTIGDEAFFACNTLKEINIPENIVTIGEGALSFKNLNKITLDPQNTNFCLDEAGVLFNKDKTLLIRYPVAKTDTSYTIPTSVKRIAKSAFQNADNLTTITIPEGVTEIGERAFCNSHNLKTINIPSSVTSIEPGALSSCDALSNILLASNNKNFSLDKGVLYNSNKTTLVCYPAIKTDKEYIIPVTVTTIGSWAFSGMEKLTSIYITKNVTKIDLQAFNSPYSLTDIYYTGTETEWNNLIDIDSDNYDLEKITIHYNSELPEQPSEDDKPGTTPEQPGGDDKPGTTPEQPGGDDKPGTTPEQPGGDDKPGTTPEQPGGDDKPEPPTTIPVTNLTLNPKNFTLNVKNSLKVVAVIEPANATNQAVTWTSSDEKFATVDKTGKVTAVGKGTATITAEVGDKKAACSVTVTAEKVYEISFDTQSGVLQAGITNPDYVPFTDNAYTMPTVTRSGYKFNGWQHSRDAKNITAAGAVYNITADTQFIALWQSNGGGGGGHSSRPNTPGGGTVTTPTKPGTTEKPGTTGTSSGQGTVTAQNINNKFADVQNNAWYSEAIAYVYNKGMMNGTDAGKFEPNAATTRAMLVTMLFRLEGEPAAGAANFSDVASGQWFSDAIAWASAQGVVNGYENGRFAPNDALTREQLAAILYRFAQLKGQDVNVQGSLSGFSDSGSVSGWAAEAMQWAVGAGIINGDNGALKPGGNATRAEVAMMLMRFLENA